MSTKVILFLLFFSSLYAQEARSFEKVKEKIDYFQKCLEETETDHQRNPFYFQLALAYSEDQEIDKAFAYFLKALDRACPQILPEMSSEERNLYDSAWNFYMEHTGRDPVITAQELLEQFGKAAAENPEFHRLNFLLSTAFANLGMYPLFFERFYRSYPYFKDSFIAEKTKGILYLRLASHSAALDMKAAYRQEALSLLNAALEKQPKDASLYKILIYLSKEEKNDCAILFYLQKMAEVKPVLSRSDIYLYVREAVTLGECDLAQTIIDHARDIYNYSRAVSMAQEYLNKHSEG